ncbi:MULTISPECIES: dCTP deaminase/dUTPase family protein [Apilactobacillus]|uniref:dUTP diphosphatase n=1 Tax=Apilactobacillus TaxID=2767877 RepID=UPI001127EB83|nr:MULTISPECIES: dUTP diphosphatase [Apilactobacillus]TPR16703.1 dUTP diphosphatase [Apilactobacillus timberlakei]TPR21565.1 dUTP diphosphatase [Apilactobacillus timberlakei]TPR50761.1 dUTP diphosphatase [Apilactobacillus micheneri]
MNKIYFDFVSSYKNDSTLSLPKRSTDGSAGYDFNAAESVTLEPYSTSKKVYMIKTGIRAIMPHYVYLQLSNRSSNAKKGLECPNGIGIVDADYYTTDNEGHIMFPLINIKDEPYHIEKNDRVFQGVFLQHLITGNDTAKHSNNTRKGGFGSSGK